MNEISNNVPEDGGTANGPALTGSKSPDGPYSGNGQLLANAGGPIGLSNRPVIPIQPRGRVNDCNEPTPERPVDCDEEDCGDDCCCESPGEPQCCDEGYAIKKAYEYEFRDFSIKHLNAGYIVTIGCHKIAIETKEKLAKIVSNYILDPNKTEEAFHKEKTVDSML